jgi:hypothetical protein
MASDMAYKLAIVRRKASSDRTHQGFDTRRNLRRGSNPEVLIIH